MWKSHIILCYTLRLRAKNLILLYRYYIMHSTSSSTVRPLFSADLNYSLFLRLIVIVLECTAYNYKDVRLRGSAPTLLCEAMTPEVWNIFNFNNKGLSLTHKLAAFVRKMLNRRQRMSNATKRLNYVKISLVSLSLPFFLPLCVF